MDITFKRLDALPFKQVIALWNRGFEGYFSNVEMNEQMIIARMAGEGLSLENSIAAFVGDEPVGFVMNAVRDAQGVKLSWNGGTGVIPEYRGKGVGRKLIEEILRINSEQGVDIATLEAMAQNETAIRLYEKMGYERKENLFFYQSDKALTKEAFPLPASDNYLIATGSPSTVSRLSFYRRLVPWQTQWESVQGGSSLTVTRLDGEEVGYALFKENRDHQGNKVGVNLYQCVAAEAADQKEILAFMLHRIWSPLESAFMRRTVNLPAQNNHLIELLEEAGFTISVKQVFMTKRLTGSVI